jgi:hypothetical protein
MCVRELRTEAPNTSVFYMAAVSLVAAVIGCFLPMAWGDSTSFKVPDRWFQWLLLLGIGEHSWVSNLGCSPSYTLFKENPNGKEGKTLKACPLQHAALLPLRAKRICPRMFPAQG